MNFDLIECYSLNISHSADFQYINNQSKADIDFDELFRFMDRTSSKIGQQYLYNRLITIDKNINFESREKLVELIDKNEEMKVKICTLLSKLNGRSGDIRRPTNECLDKHERRIMLISVPRPGRQRFTDKKRRSNVINT
ncbi:MAG: hypothetical protein LBT42_02405 [Tannerella sp.]|jgi:hypothetical protein|nr:hypothetical protein [Tannerella sp.]